MDKSVETSPPFLNGDAIQSLMVDGLASVGVNTDINSISYLIASVIALVLLALLSLSIVRFILHFKVVRLILRSKNTWDDALLDTGVFKRLAHIIPGIAVYVTFPSFFNDQQLAYQIVSSLSVAYLIIAVWLTINALLTAVEKIYAVSSLAKKAPITGFIQVARLLVTLAVVFLVISLLLGKSPVYLLSGLTAIAAVLLLIFRDTILGFVAGIQIAANRMFNTGDWIEMPKYGVDGEITLIGLNVVKVQNWDKTISTIPTYALTTDAVKNWRGMSESGGRRIKRAIQIDIHSVTFATKANLEHWKRFKLIESYLNEKQKALLEDTKTRKLTDDDIHNQRRLTNIGTFRAYVSEYLKQHPQVNQDLTRMVRQLKPSELGIPIEIYCFSKQKDWVAYEHIQADIFDHLLAVLPAFGLVAYQRVSSIQTKPDV
ncbi:mechanosensitive ion channel family protein [Glaciecola sp. KUL10]|uniref:mechanosensitive ion channel family protein n=1 Tax=Glaciecola sp. (strain KUL10) TaxID=2161813 RepID=UPI000D78873D|nr:mechanosensitive ion channel family protein [Glaciecola sp. KUL10]GBL06013.1 mechanosensitive ion channel [Glaciecola sp. KUL10]